MIFEENYCTLMRQLQNFAKNYSILFEIPMKLKHNASFNLSHSMNTLTHQFNLNLKCMNRKNALYNPIPAITLYQNKTSLDRSLSNLFKRMFML